jgi:hypothetical protein
VFSPHDEDIASLALNARLPLLATSSGYNAVKIWNIQDLVRPVCVQEIVGHRAAATAVLLLDSDRMCVTERERERETQREREREREAGLG